MSLKNRTLLSTACILTYTLKSDIQEDDLEVEDFEESFPECDLSIDNIDVKQSERRKGYASKAIEALKRMYPTAVIGLHTSGEEHLKTLYEKNGFIFQGACFAVFKPALSIHQL